MRPALALLALLFLSPFCFAQDFELWGSGGYSAIGKPLGFLGFGLQDVVTDPVTLDNGFSAEMRGTINNWIRELGASERDPTPTLKWTITDGLGRVSLSSTTGNQIQVLTTSDLRAVMNISQKFFIENPDPNTATGVCVQKNMLQNNKDHASPEGITTGFSKTDTCAQGFGN